MDNTNLTASAIMSFSEKLENDSAAFYEKLAKKYDKGEDTFSSFAENSRKNKTHLVRTYQETISDALEASFSFEGLELKDFDFESMSMEDTSYKDALKMAIEIEEKAVELYSRIAEQAKSLLATIPGAFLRVAKKRRDRKEILKSLMDPQRGP